MKNKVVIIGAGPGGMFSAYLLLKQGYSVDLYDQSSGVGKKFLVAGKGGLNLTHSEKIEKFASRYGKDKYLFAKLLQEFPPSDLLDWCNEIGVETFIGTSGRLFPKNLTASEILTKLMSVLNANKRFNLYLEHRLLKINNDKTFIIQKIVDKTISTIHSDNIIFSLGGASWKKTGSDGKWKKYFDDLGIKVHSFMPMNCGFERTWSEYFIKKVDRHPLKNIKIIFDKRSEMGEVMLTPFGIEGSGVYAVSYLIRDEICSQGSAHLYLDLRPSIKLDELIQKIRNKSKKITLSNHLRKSINIDKKIFILLKEILDDDSLNCPEKLAMSIKKLDIELFSPRPIDEAISTSGGICFSELNDSLELKKIPGMYVIGEMLNFEAPTGGYLLQGCFATAFAAVTSIINKNSYS